MAPDAPALPPYSFMDTAALQCVVDSARRWDVPELLIHSVIAKEGGKPGTWSRNNNGTFDLGPAQINTATWKDYIAPHGITTSQLASNTCLNIQAAAYVLKTYHIRMSGDWHKAVMAYHIGPNRWQERPKSLARGQAYASHVFNIWKYLAEYAEKYSARYTGHPTLGEQEK